MSLVTVNSSTAAAETAVVRACAAMEKADDGKMIARDSPALMRLLRFKFAIFSTDYNQKICFFGLGVMLGRTTYAQRVHVDILI